MMCYLITQDSLNHICMRVLKKLVYLETWQNYILTHGGEEFQLDKIKRTGIIPLFSYIIVVFEKKTKTIEKICTKYKDEKIFFIDDKQKHFDELNMKKCPHLKTILYN